jgi:hypothetical protein
MADYAAALAELATMGLGDLVYGTNPGCCGSRSAGGSAPRQCDIPPTHSVIHPYDAGRSRPARRLVCTLHARLGEDARPLTDDELARDAERRAHVRDAWARQVRYGDY